MKITIITPSYNQADYLEETIDSVLSQGYPDLEYMVFDGGSTDHSVEVIKKYEAHLSYWESKPDKGQSDAINKGLHRATGDIINWLNSDDYYEAGTLHKVAAAFEKPETLMVAGRSRLFNDADQRTLSYSRGTDIYPGQLARSIGQARIDQPETFFRKEAIDQMGLLNARLHYIMDKEWYIRFLLHFGQERTVQIPDMLVHFRYHESSKTVSQQARFSEETHSLFHELALAAGCSTEASLLADLNPSTLSGLEADYVKGHETLVKQALHYFILHRADEYYYTDQKELSARCLEAVDLSLLDAEAGKRYQKIKTRNQIPTLVRKGIRKLRG